jgi:NADPH:quinone reductase-like Zn-dependent oxidoreductase
VIATSSSDAKLERVRQMGAPTASTTRRLRLGRVLEPTGGVGVDHAVGPVRGTLGRSLKAVRMGGRISLIGILSGGGEVNRCPS